MTKRKQKKLTLANLHMHYWCLIWFGSWAGYFFAKGTIHSLGLFILSMVLTLIVNVWGIVNANKELLNGQEEDR